MIEGGNFNITNTIKPTNKDIIVVFSPAQNIKNYQINIYKDNLLIQSENINTNEEKAITLKETGTYQIKVKTINNENKETQVNSGIYIIDKEAPVITVSQEQIEISNIKNMPNDIAKAKDNQDGDLTNQITMTNLNSNQTKQTITYTVSDEAGNTTTKNIEVLINEPAYSLYAIQTLIIILTILIIYLITKFIKTLNLSKRIEPFTIEPLQNKEPSLIDRIINLYQNKLNKWETNWNKSIITQKYSKYLEKYSSISNIHQNGTQIFISKIILAFLFIIIAIFAKAIKFKLLTIYELTIPFLVGFFLLDIVYFIKYKAYQNKLENDLLSAIIIMNNAFKAGRSIIQAIDIVSKEMDGRMSKEFSKMSLELSYGLEIDTVFKRMGERIKLEEVNYLTASLSILNKTGGNIIEVFSSIEKTMFNKKKLRLELNSLTASSKLIVYVLFIVPFLFILFISIISPGYFAPFITTNIGRILLLIMILYYLIFIFTVRKIMKVVI